MADGEFLRYGYPPTHECKPPDQTSEGSVWRCNCGRRWTAMNSSNSFRYTNWQRRYWPWPR